MQDKKGQTSGVITSLVFGVASLVIGVIIAFVMVSTLTNANLLTATRTTSTVTNESTGGINVSGYTVNNANAANLVSGSFVLTGVWTDVAGAAIVVPLTNVTLSTSGVATNSTNTVYSANATVSYTYNLLSNEEVSSSSLRSNFTNGIDNVSGKIPTVLLIAAIVLILGVLAVLVGVWQRMRSGGSSL